MKSARLLSIAAGLLLSLGVPSGTPRADSTLAAPEVLAPGYSPLHFDAPDPASYSLPVLFAAADGEVISDDGHPLHLHSLYQDKVVLLSFIYSTCSDVNGCPLATAVFHKIQRRLKEAPDLHDHLRLVTLSFNPTFDTPEVMRRYGEGFKGGNVDWVFLTSHSDAQIGPILKNYGQTIKKELDADGKPTGNFSHILRVYLIDRQKRVRNIYSTSFLHAETLLNDVRTLLRDAPTPATPDRDDVPADKTRIVGYDRQTDKPSDFPPISRKWQNGAGTTNKLIAFAYLQPLGLPAVPVPDDNPITAHKVALGRKLFYDRRLSLNNTMSCAMCHIPEQGFTNNETATSIGFEGRTVKRNAPTLYNVGYHQRLFHDGRETSLEQQVWGPFLASNEMANPSIGYVMEKLRSLPDYQGLFEKAFSKGPTMGTVGKALASYERTLNSANSPFDRWYFGRDNEAIDDRARRGFRLFTGKAGCSSCHTVASNQALFTDHRMHNTGVGYRQAMHKPDTQSVQLAPGISIEIDAAVIAEVSAPRDNDLGYYEITQDPQDRWKFKTPSLRNVALTSPYMHDGSIGTLKEVVDFYNRGGVPNETLDPLIRPLGLSYADTLDLVGFLEALTGDNVDELVQDATAAPIGDPHPQTQSSATQTGSAGEKNER